MARLTSILVLLALTACSRGFFGKGDDPEDDDDDDQQEADADTDADADSDTDSDADSDTDTDTDSDADSASDTDTDPEATDDDGDGYSEDAGDCDDTDPDVGPAEEEVAYDGVDNDCDERTPDDDLDGDGEDSTETGGGDCDDEDPTVGPDEEEVHDDGVDNDCDGSLDERFETEVLDDKSDCGSPSAVAVDSSGQVLVAYHDLDSLALRFLERDIAGTWSAGTDIVSYTGVATGEYVDAVVDAADRFQVAYTYYDWSGTGYTELDFVYRDAGGTWSSDYVVDDYAESGSTDLGFYVSIDVDSSNLPSFAYFDYGSGLPILADFTTIGVAVYVSVDIDYTGRGTGWYTSLAIDDEDYDHVAYYDPNANLGLAPEVQYTNFDTDLDSIEFSEKVGDEGAWTSVAVDGLTPCVAWQDTTSADLKYACRVSDTWTEETVDSRGSVGAYASLAFDSAGNPWVAYYDETNGDLKVATDDGAGWTTMTVDSAGDVGQACDLAIDDADFVHVTYFDATNGALKYALGY